MIMPAMVGPIMRAPLNMEELSAMALARSFLSSTISTMNDCRAGMSTALTRPWNILRAMMCQISITPVTVSIARVSDWVMARICANSITLRLFQRSIRTPAMRRQDEAGDLAGESHKSEQKS